MQQNFHSVGIGPRIADAFYRYRWLFVISVVVVTSIVTAALTLRKDTYKAYASTQVVTDNETARDALGEQSHTAAASPSQQNVDQLTDMLGDNRPDGFLDTALRAANLKIPIRVDPRAEDKRLARLRKGLSVTSDSNALFTIGLTWDDASECERIVQAIQNQYIEEIGLNRQVQSIATTKFLDSEIRNYERRMREAEQALIAYKQSNSGNLPETQAAELQQLTSLKTQRDNLIVSSRDSGLKRQALEHRMAQIKPMSVFEQTVGDAPSVQSIRQLQTKRAQYIAEGYTQNSDVVHDLDKEIDRLQRQSAGETPGGKSGNSVVQTRLQNNPEYQSLMQQLTDARIAEQTQLAQADAVNRQIADYEGRIKNMPSAQRALTDRMRDYTVLKTQYENLLERREQAQLKANLDKITARSTMVRVGTIYAEPTTTRSKKLIMIAGSVFVGLLVGVTVVVLSEWSDQTLRYGADTERFLDLPVLAVVDESQILKARSI